MRRPHASIHLDFQIREDAGTSKWQCSSSRDFLDLRHHRYRSNEPDNFAMALRITRSLCKKLIESGSARLAMNYPDGPVTALEIHPGENACRRIHENTGNQLASQRLADWTRERKITDDGTQPFAARTRRGAHFSRRLAKSSRIATGASLEKWPKNEPVPRLSYGDLAARLELHCLVLRQLSSKNKSRPGTVLETAAPLN